MRLLKQFSGILTFQHAVECVAGLRIILQAKRDFSAPELLLGRAFCGGDICQQFGGFAELVGLVICNRRR